MASMCIVVICCVLGLSAGLPLPSEPVYLETGDTEVVGSVIREVRAALPSAVEVADLLQAGTGQDPDNFEHHWDSGDKGTTGYLKKSEDKGSDGYKHFDSFHKKDGDKYGFEHHTAFGHGAKDGKDGYQHHSKHQKADEDGKGPAKQGTHNSYQVSENVSEYDPSYESDSAPFTAYDGDYGDFTAGADSGSTGGHYTDSGSDAEGGQSVEGNAGEHYTEEEADAAQDGESEQYTEGDADAGQYVEDDGDGESAGYYSEGDSGESQHFTADDDYDY